MSFLFGSIFFGAPILTLVWWYWADGRVRRAKLCGAPAGVRAGWCWARISLAAFGAAFFLGFLWLLLGRMRPDLVLQLGLPRVPAPLLMGLLMLWAMVVLPLVALPSILIWTAWRAGEFALAIARRIGGPRIPRDELHSPGPNGLTRRELLTGALATAPVWTTVTLAGFGSVQKRHFRIRELSVEIPSLPAALDGVTIAQVSDTHVGKFTRGEILHRIADATNDLAADLVLMTGDLIDHSVYDLPEAVRMLDRIDRRSGLFLIEGNHDLFDGRDAFAGGLREADYSLLLNEAATIRLRGAPVQIMGVMWHGRSGSIEEHVAKVGRLRDPQAFPILLAHHPHSFDHAAALGIPLTLAGHTHGGQLMLTDDIGAGPAIFKYWSGVYEQGASRLVVSNGVGNWFPVRTNAPAEILHITLRSVA
jgi:uncharacterized protein